MLDVVRIGPDESRVNVDRTRPITAYFTKAALYQQLLVTRQFRREYERRFALLHCFGVISQCGPGGCKSGVGECVSRLRVDGLLQQFSRSDGVSVPQPVESLGIETKC